MYEYNGGRVSSASWAQNLQIYKRASGTIERIEKYIQLN
jgi:hypothetical protein